MAAAGWGVCGRAGGRGAYESAWGTGGRQRSVPSACVRAGEGVLGKRCGVHVRVRVHVRACVCVCVRVRREGEVCMGRAVSARAAERREGLRRWRGLGVAWGSGGGVWGGRKGRGGVVRFVLY